MKLKEVMTSMDYEKLYKAYYLQVYSYTISLAKNLFHKSLQFLEKQNHGRELLIIVQS